MFFNSVLVIVSFIIPFCFGYLYFLSCDTKLIATMTIIKVQHPFNANLEIFPMIIELCQAQDTGRDLEMTSTKNIYAHSISRGNRPSIQSIQSESNPDMLRSIPGLFMLHHIGKRVQFIKTLKHIK